MEAALCGVTASSSSRMMASHGEGIYASSTSVYVGIQETDQIGLTLSPKIRSGKEVSLDTYVIAHHDFDDASNQFEPLSGETDERMSSFRRKTTYGACLSNLSPPSKKRRLSGCLSGASFQRLNSISANGFGSISFLTSTGQKCTKQFLQPKPSMLSPDFVRVCTMNWQRGDENKNSCLKSWEVSPFSPCDPPACIRACQENFKNSHPSSNDNMDSTEQTSPKSTAFMSSHHYSLKGRGIRSTGLNYTIAGNNFQEQAKGIQYSDNPGISAYKMHHQNLVSATDLSRCKSFRDPDVPMQSIERESHELVPNRPSGIQNSKTLSLTRNLASNFSSRLSQGANGTNLGATSMAANETTRNFIPSQDLIQSLLNPLQTPTLAPIIRHLYEKYQQALVESQTNHPSSHYIPDELRKLFDALLRKYQTDQHVRHCITRFIMRVTGEL